MNKIKFRGIDKRYNKNNKPYHNIWRYGDLCNYQNGQMAIASLAKSYGHSTVTSEVVPETVGQYVEIIDAYDGDILRGYEDFDGETGDGVYWYGVVKFDDEAGRIRIVGDDDMWYEADDFNFEEIIGNVHDNPNFLGE
jgi:hypothetical protein